MIKKICKTCKIEFIIKPSRKSTAKFCSHKCVRFSKKTKKLLSKQRKGVRKTENHKIKLSLSKMNEKNPMWKITPGLDAVHEWIRSRKPKPKLCVKCRKNPPMDLANISQKYHRDIKDFDWLCRKCHMKSDGRYKKIKNGIRKLKSGTPL